MPRPNATYFGSSATEEGAGIYLKINLKTEEFNPPASKESREEANLTGRKIPHTLVYGVKEFVCLYLDSV